MSNSEKRELDAGADTTSQAGQTNLTNWIVVMAAPGLLAEQASNGSQALKACNFPIVIPDIALHEAQSVLGPTGDIRALLHIADATQSNITEHQTGILDRASELAGIRVPLRDISISATENHLRATQHGALFTTLVLDDQNYASRQFIPSDNGEIISASEFLSRLRPTVIVPRAAELLELLSHPMIARITANFRILVSDVALFTVANPKDGATPALIEQIRMLLNTGESTFNVVKTHFVEVSSDAGVNTSRITPDTNNTVLKQLLSLAAVGKHVFRVIKTSFSAYLMEKLSNPDLPEIGGWQELAVNIIREAADWHILGGKSYVILQKGWENHFQAHCYENEYACDLDEFVQIHLTGAMQNGRGG